MTKLASVMLALAACALARDYKLEEREAIRHTFNGDNTLDVDQVNGSTTVIGDGGNSIRVEGEKIMRADTSDEMNRAKHDVVLDINEKGGVAQLYVNGPFRNNDYGHTSSDHGFHEHGSDGRGDRRYEVIYNFTIHVPRAMALELRSVNGSVNAQDTSGKFELRTVNGKLNMTNVSGSGTASTVNGETKATFRENPKAECSFKTVNGSIDIGFQPGFGADLHLKTLNGGVFTDFEATALANGPGEKSNANGMFVYKTNRERNVRIGAGGPQMHLETLNGTIKVRKL